MKNESNARAAAGPKLKWLLKIFYALPVLFIAGLCGLLAWNRVAHQKLPIRPISAKPFASTSIAGLTANFFTQGNQLRAAGNDLFIEFRDGQGNLSDVGDVVFELRLNMPDMVMHSLGKVFRTATPGQYRTTVEPQLAGDWTATLSFSRTNGKATNNFAVAVK